MQIGVPKEIKELESRVAIPPSLIKKYIKKGLSVVVENNAGEKANFPNDNYEKEGAKIVSRDEVFKSDIIVKINRPTEEEVRMMKKGSLLISFLEPYLKDGLKEKLSQNNVNSISMELIPRTSRAQSMDVLSSQANIAGYRAVITAANFFGRFFPMMMTSAGLAKPAKVIVLGAGVAGLQAIATAKRLGAIVDAFDIRPEVKEQILSLGGKFVEIDVGESGVGAGGYAKELTQEGRKKQQEILTEKLKKYDVIISTAAIPGKKAPTLIVEDAVKGMTPGSVIIDMAAATGGNCPLTEENKVVVKHGVTIVGYTNYPSLMAADSSTFYANNVLNLLSIMVENKDGNTKLNLNLEDDIIAASLITLNGSVRI